MFRVTRLGWLTNDHTFLIAAAVVFSGCTTTSTNAFVIPSDIIVNNNKFGRTRGIVHYPYRDDPLYISDNKNEIHEIDKDLKEAYKWAEEEDSEWFNEFVLKVLKTDSAWEYSQTSGNNLPSNKTELKIRTRDSDQCWDESNLEMISGIIDKKSQDGGGDRYELNADSFFEEDEKINNFEHSESKEELSFNQIEMETATECGRMDFEEGSPPKLKDEISLPSTVADEEILLRNLGYSEEEYASMAPDALEIILEDSLRRPKGGIPPMWIKVEDPTSVENVMPRKKEEALQRPLLKNERNSSNQTRSQKFRRGSDVKRERVPKRSQRQSKHQEQPLEYDMRVNRRMHNRSNRRSSQQPSYRRNLKNDQTISSRRSSRRQSSRSRNSRLPEKDSNLWPSVPTFKSFLRREAQLRLFVLGPSWKSMIKNESQWRLDLYKLWLNAFEDDIDDEESLPSPAQRKRRRIPR